MIMVASSSPPAIELVLGEGTTYAAPATLALSAAVATNGQQINGVRFLDGSAMLAEVTVPPYRWTWKNVPAGQYTLTAELAYNGNSTVTSAVAGVTITNAPVAFVAPTISLTAPANGWAYSAPATILLSAAVAANGNTVNKVQFYCDSALLGEVASAPYGLTLSNLTAGTYQLRSRLLYNGAQWLDSAPAAILVTNSWPAIAFFPVVSGYDYMAPETLALVANVTTNGRQIHGVRFFNRSTMLAQANIPPYRWTWKNVPAGEYQLRAELGFDATNVLVSATSTVAITNPLPVIRMVSPASGTSYTAKADVSLTASVTANGRIINSVQFFNGPDFIGESLTGPYSCTWSNLGLGTYAVTARLVYDAGASVYSTPASFSVVLPPPWQTITIGTGSTAGEAWGSDGQFMVSGAGNISGSSDSFQFLCQSSTTNVSLTTQIGTVMNTGDDAAVGLMFRDKLDPDSKHAMLLFAPDNSVHWVFRTSNRGMTFSQPVGAAPADSWARLSFADGLLTAMICTNNATWVVVNSEPWQFSTNFYLGLAVASGSTNMLNTSAFFNVTVSTP
jgi:hypothetical protein